MYRQLQVAQHTAYQSSLPPTYPTKMKNDNASLMYQFQASKVHDARLAMLVQRRVTNTDIACPHNVGHIPTSLQLQATAATQILHCIMDQLRLNI